MNMGILPPFGNRVLKPGLIKDDMKPVLMDMISVVIDWPMALSVSFSGVIAGS